MSATIARPRITAAELAEADAQYAEITRELETAKVHAAKAADEADRLWNSQIAQRANHEAAATVRNLTERANNLARFLQSADVDPEPEPTSPAPVPAGIAEAVRIVALERDRRVITARQYGTCRCCGHTITPGQRITSTFAAGVWAHAGCWETDMAKRRAEGERVREERGLAGMFLAFIDRLPQAA